MLMSINTRCIEKGNGKSDGFSASACCVSVTKVLVRSIETPNRICGDWYHYGCQPKPIYTIACEQAKIRYLQYNTKPLGIQPFCEKYSFFNKKEPL